MIFQAEAEVRWLDHCETRIAALPEAASRRRPLVSVLALRDVSRVHGTGETAVRALSHVSLIVEPGELVAVMGPSGSGKSTLLNLAGGLDSPTEGAVLVEGTDLANLNRHELAAVRRRSAGYVFQDLNLIPALTAAENVVAAARARRRAAARRPQGGDQGARGGRHGRARRPLPRRALRRPAAARRDRARARRAAHGWSSPTSPPARSTATTGEMVLRVLRTRCDNGASGVLVTHEARHAAWADRVVFLRDGALVDDTGVAQPAESLLQR